MPPPTLPRPPSCPGFAVWRRVCWALPDRLAGAAPDSWFQGHASGQRRGHAEGVRDGFERGYEAGRQVLVIRDSRPRMLPCLAATTTSSTTGACR